jgi:hypothetical protein
MAARRRPTVNPEVLRKRGCSRLVRLVLGGSLGFLVG